MTRRTTAVEHTSPRARLVEFLAITSLLVALAVVLELALFIVTLVSPRLAISLAHPSRRAVKTSAAAESWRVPDPVLGFRLRPNVDGNDGRGFRNPQAIDQAEIVCLGDSQTQGYALALGEAWPHRLASILDKTTYNMGVGGWGPVHSKLILDEALALRPRLVIEALYSGNDLWDAYALVYERRQSLDLLSEDPAVLAAIDALERDDPLLPRITELYEVYVGSFSGTGLLGESVDASASIARDSGPRLRWSLRRFLSYNSRLYGLLRAVKDELTPRSRRDARVEAKTWRRLQRRARLSAGLWEVFESGTLRTIFVPKYRLIGLDLDDSRIREGHRIALDAIFDMNQRLQEVGVEFLVALIPTKLLVFAPFVHTPSETFRNLVQGERLMWTETKQVLEAAGVQYVDVLPALRSPLRDGKQPYQITQDGHPNRLGHEIMARVIADQIRDQLR